MFSLNVLEAKYQFSYEIDSNSYYNYIQFLFDANVLRVKFIALFKYTPVWLR